MTQMTSTVEFITPAIAEEYLKKNTDNRPLSNNTVNKYVREIENGEWKRNGESISFSEDGVLLNGQHRLHAIIKSGHTIETVVVRGCDNDSFTTCDGGKARSNADVFAIAHIKHYKLVASVVNKYVFFHKGVSSLGKESALNAFKITKADLLDTYRKNSNLFDYAIELSRKYYSKLHLLNIQEIGGMFVYLVADKQHDEDLVQNFFRMLFYGDNITNSTVSVLRERIIKDKISNNTMTPPDTSWLS